MTPRPPPELGSVLQVAPDETCDLLFWANETHTCLYAGYREAFTELQIGMLIFAFVAGPIFNKTRDTVATGAIVALLAGALFPILPGNVAGAAWVVVFLALGATVFGAIYRYFYP